MTSSDSAAQQDAGSETFTVTAAPTEVAEIILPVASADMWQNLAAGSLAGAQNSDALYAAVLPENTLTDTLHQQHLQQVV